MGKGLLRGVIYICLSLTMLTVSCMAQPVSTQNDCVYVTCGQLLDNGEIEEMIASEIEVKYLQNYQAGESDPMTTTFLVAGILILAVILNGGPLLG